MPALELLSMNSPVAEASGYYFTDAGTRGMSRGGAFIASANDLSAQYYSPAALINLKRSQFYVNHSLVSQEIALKRQDYVENDDGYVGNEQAPAIGYDGEALPGGYPAATNVAAPMNIPQLAVGSSLGVKDAYFAFGLHPPSRPRWSTRTASGTASSRRGLSATTSWTRWSSSSTPAPARHTGCCPGSRWAPA